MTYRKKLIEVALPLEAINIESAREKSIRHGHPSTLHLWWARRPLAACRAVLWASLVDDPSSWPEKFPTEEAQNKERQRLFDILGRIEIEKDKKGNTKQVVRGLVSWDEINKPNSAVLVEAQREIARCLAWERGEEPPTKPDTIRDYIAKYAPPAYDPFCGGGSIPLEAQRLGLEAHGSDLNPVAVLITKALIEIPPKFKGKPPVRPHFPSPPNPLSQRARGNQGLEQWYGAQGLAEDVRYYGQWMRDEAFKRIGDLYPKVRIAHPLPLTPSPIKGENHPLPLTPSPIKGKNHPLPLTPSPIKGEGEQERWEISAQLKQRMIEIARQLRKEQTKSEEILWQAIRGAKLEGRKFRRQQPIGSFVVDFFCAAERLIVEVDGGIHNTQKELDQQRQALLESLGLRFVRLSTEQVEKNLDLCLAQIKSAFFPSSHSHLLTSPPIKRENHLHSLTPSPMNGEGEQENLSSLSPLSPGGRGAGGEGAKSTEATVIAWLWARTVKCPNPVCGCQMPLVNKFHLSTKKGKEAWVEPVVDRPHPLTPSPTTGEGEQENKHNHSPLPQGEGPGVRVQFEVKTGKGKAPDGTVNRKGAVCIACNTPVPFDHIRSEGKAGRMDAQLMAIVAEGQGRRVYLSPDEEQVRIAKKAQPEWKPEFPLPNNPRNFNSPNYGLDSYDKLFTPRQLVALTTFSDLVSEAREKIKADAVAAGMTDDDLPLNDGGIGARGYADAVATYLAFAVDRLADRSSAICSWDTGYVKVRNTFARQAIPMTWDFAEANPMSDSTGNFNGAIDWVVEVIEKSSCSAQGQVIQIDATAKSNDETAPRIISTDPPYYDNIGYADLADFFYVWLRRSLNSVYPDIFSTLLVPKAPELVATPYRFGGDKQKAKSFFEEGLGKAFRRMNEMAHSDYPLTVYYAFKQAETEHSDDDEGNDVVSSTGWETMLEGLIKSDFSIDGTWPMRSELSNRMVASGTNALASSIVLVCRPRPTDAPKATRRQFLNELKRDLPHALKLLQQGNIAPVDLAQASIGPGMAVFSKYAAVLESDGSPMRVRTALQLINQILDEFLTEQEGEFDGDTRWALTWFEQYQFNEGQYGDVETLSKAKNTSVQGMVEAGILEAKAGKVRLLKRDSLTLPASLSQRAREGQDSISPLSPRGRGAGGEGANQSQRGRGAGGEGANHWFITQYLIRTLDQDGETGAAELLAKLGSKANLARDLAYRLYSLCDRKGWTQEGIAYNSLVTSWPEITRLANEYKPSPQQTTLPL